MNDRNEAAEADFGYDRAEIARKIRDEFIEAHEMSRDELVDYVIRLKTEIFLQQSELRHVNSLWRESDFHLTRLSSGLHFIKQMMCEDNSDPVALTKAVSIVFEAPEIADALSARSIATAAKAGRARATNSPKERQRIRIYSKFKIESSALGGSQNLPHGWVKLFAARMAYEEEERFGATGGEEGSNKGAVSQKTIEGWVSKWRKGENIPASS